MPRAGLGIPGVDAIVDSGVAARLGLTADVAVLINAPAADLATLMSAGARGRRRLGARCGTWCRWSR